jgi:transposase
MDIRERNQKIIAMRKQGAKYAEIADTLGVTRNVVANVLYRSDNVVSRYVDPIDPAVRRAAVEMAWRTTYREAAEHFGVSASVIGVWARAS